MYQYGAPKLHYMFIKNVLTLPNTSPSTYTPYRKCVHPRSIRDLAITQVYSLALTLALAQIHSKEYPRQSPLHECLFNTIRDSASTSRTLNSKPRQLVSSIYMHI